MTAGISGLKDGREIIYRARLAGSRPITKRELTSQHILAFRLCRSGQRDPRGS